MSNYIITQTTDKKHIGENISIDKENRCFKYITTDVCRSYDSISEYHNHIRIINSNYTIHASLLE